MSSTGRMRLCAPLLLAGAMTLATGLAAPAFAHGNGCRFNGHNGHHHHSRCNGFNGHHHNGHHHNGHHHFNGHHHVNGHGFVHWHRVREPVFGFRTRLVPHVHRGFVGFSGCPRSNGFNGFNGFTDIGFFD
jgi:hypothetical protein